MHLYSFSVISRFPYISKQEQDKTRQAIADEHRPLGDLMNKKFCRLPNEHEIALANINQRKQALAEVKKDKKTSVTASAMSIPPATRRRTQQSLQKSTIIEIKNNESRIL